MTKKLTNQEKQDNAEERLYRSNMKKLTKYMNRKTSIWTTGVDFPEEQSKRAETYANFLPELRNKLFTIVP